MPLARYTDGNVTYKPSVPIERWTDDPALNILFYLSTYPLYNKEIPLSKFGGRNDITLNSTGFFYVTSFPVSNRWVFVDPEGHPLISLGFNSVSPADVNLPINEEFNNVVFDIWAKDISALFDAAKSNTFSSWGDYEAVNNTGNKINYTPNLNLMLNYRSYRRNIYPYNDDNPVNGKPTCIYPFDPEFEPWLDAYILSGTDIVAKSLSADPYLLGYFIDNEQPISSSGILTNYLKFGPGDPNYEAATEYINNLGRTPTQDDNDRFAGEVAQLYYRKTCAAIRKYDPNHLILGNRTFGSGYTNQYIISGTSNITDVFSINLYGKWYPSMSTVSMLTSYSNNRPFLISEFFASTTDVDIDNNRMSVGFIVKSEFDRQLFYKYFVQACIGYKCFVGYHWFSFPDIYISNNHLSYALLSGLESFNKNIYNLLDISDS